MHKSPELNKNRDFTATIFIIQLGPDGPQFHAHESVLKRSPKLAEEIDKAKANKRATKQNTLPLMAHDAIAFEQMLQFLYKDKFLISKNKNTPVARLAEFKELMSLAKHYVLPALQKQVVKLFSSSKIVAKMPPADFFDWAEDMYYEELDHNNGPFKVYLSKVAPMLMKGADDATKKDLVRMIKQGGGFAEQLFIAATTVTSLFLMMFAPEANRSRHWIRSQVSLPSRKKRCGRSPLQLCLVVPKVMARSLSVRLLIRKAWMRPWTTLGRTTSISLVHLGLLPLKTAYLILIYDAVEN